MAAIPDLHIASVLRFSDAEHGVTKPLPAVTWRAPFAVSRVVARRSVFRMPHVFDLRDGLIARDQAWFDTAGVLR